MLPSTVDNRTRTGYIVVGNPIEEAIMNLRTKSLREHAQWTELCQQLKAAGAVTEDDLNSPLTAAATPGQRLLRQVRKWGNARAALVAEEDREQS